MAPNRRTHPIAPESMFFPELRPRLERHPRLFHRLALKCMVCWSPMAIVGDGLPTSDIRDDGYATTFGFHTPAELQQLRPTADADVATIIPCGHIICKACLFHICYDGYDFDDFDPEEDDAKPDPRCPACFSNLRYEDCLYRCRFPGIPFPSNPDALGMIPPTATENFHALPPRCNCCSLADIHHNIQWIVDIDAVVSRVAGPHRSAFVGIAASQTVEEIDEPEVVSKFGKMLQDAMNSLREVSCVRPWAGAAISPALRFVLAWHDFV